VTTTVTSSAADCAGLTTGDGRPRIDLRGPSTLADLDPEAPFFLSGTDDAAIPDASRRASESSPPTTMRGMKAGAVMFVGIAIVNVGNYVFHLIAARDLGPQDYGDLVALLTLSSLVSLPLAALQVVVGRYVARFTALGDEVEANRLNRRVLAATTVFAVVAMVLITILAPFIQRWLSISSSAAIVLTAALTLPTAVTPIVWGVAQGLQRFTLLALAMALGTFARVFALLFFLVVGLSTWSAVTATLVGMLVSVLVPFVPLRGWFTQSKGVARSGSVEGEKLLRAIGPAAVALLAFTSLTQSDVLAANAVFNDTTSGVYGAASLIGRVILYLPTAIVAVLLPKVAARTAANRSTNDILGFSLLATFAFCAASTLVYALVPGTIVHLAFGAKYDGARDLLVPFGVAMTALALVNVLLYYNLGRGHNVFAWILGGGAIAQIGAFALFHNSPRGLIFDTIAVAVVILVAHEVLTRQTMLRSMGSSLLRLSGGRA
jgi:O-antigen/teichoic acid export membrane protein